MKCSNGKRFLRMAYHITAPHNGHPVPAFIETEASVLEDTTAGQWNTIIITEVLYKVQLLVENQFSTCPIMQLPSHAVVTVTWFNNSASGISSSTAGQN